MKADADDTIAAYPEQTIGDIQGTVGGGFAEAQREYVTTGHLEAEDFRGGAGSLDLRGHSDLGDDLGPDQINQGWLGRLR